MWCGADATLSGWEVALMLCCGGVPPPVLPCRHVATGRHVVAVRGGPRLVQGRPSLFYGYYSGYLYYLAIITIS